MSRLDSAEKRLHDAISRLEAAVETRAGATEAGATEAGATEAGAAAESELRAQIANLEAERDATEKRMETAAVRMDTTIERLRGALGD